MRMYELILKTRNGIELSDEELRFIVEGYTAGEIPDYQMAAWCMAVYFRGLTVRETATLTSLMANSGQVVDLSEIPGIKVDKHSTGGVADTTTLVVGPMVAAAGAPVAKISGRGLGHTGGTLDKLESIPGFRTSLSREEFVRNVNSIGLAVISSSADLAPADKKLYALRDVTATVDSVPLIASSIMSKKIAGGADGIVLDVKVGNGAFIKQRSEARLLAGRMVAIGKEVGRKTVAVLSDMNQPLGNSIGNALEVAEAVRTLKGEGSPALAELAIALGSQMLVIAGIEPDTGRAKARLRRILETGKALEKLVQFIEAQGGDPRVVDDLSILPGASVSADVVAENDGWVTAIQTEKLGLAAMSLGAGRAMKDDVIDLSAGIIIHKRIGDGVSTGERVATLLSNDASRIEEVAAAVKNSFQIGEERVEPPALVYETVGPDQV